MPNVTRRGFLKVSSAAVSAAALAGYHPKNAAPAGKPPSAPSGEDGRIQRLTGTWKLLPHLENRGRNDRWFAAVQEGAKPAPVPGMIQQVFPYYGVAWYWHEFTPTCLPTAQSKVLHRNKEMGANPGASSNYGGIMQPVELRAVPVVRIADAFVRPNPHDGRVPVTVALRNDTDKAVEAHLVSAIGPASAEERTANAWTERTLTVAPAD